MYRNTYLLVSILAVVAALIVGVNVGKKISLTPLKFVVGVKVAMPVLLLMDASIFETGVEL